MQSTLFSIGNSSKAENFIYTDASADWKKTVNGRGTGLICIQINEEAPIVEKIELNFPGLKQLINRFELLAIERAKEIAIIEKGLNNIQIFSDSKVAVGWSKDTKVSWVPRENNKAGVYLEKEGSFLDRITKVRNPTEKEIVKLKENEIEKQTKLLKKEEIKVLKKEEKLRFKELKRLKRLKK